MVGHAERAQPFRGRDPAGREADGFAKETVTASGEAPRRDVTAEGDEVPPPREQVLPRRAVERVREILAAGFVAEAAEHFQVHHSGDPIAAPLAPGGVNEAAHGGAFVERGFFVHERDEPERVARAVAGIRFAVLGAVWTTMGGSCDWA